MRTFFLIMSLLCLYCTAQAQDLIITTSNDSIRCKVIEIKSTHVAYLKKINNEYVQNSILAGEVKSVQYDVFPADANTEIRYQKHKTRGNHDLMIGLSAGLGYLTAKEADGTPSDISAHIDALRSGFSIQASAVYFVSPKVGFGVMYNMFQTAHTAPAIAFRDSAGNRILAPVSDDITTHFIAPTFWYRFVQTNKFAFMVNVSLGHFSYHNNASVVRVPVELTTSTAGFYFSFQADYAFTETVSAFAHFSTFGASSKSFDVKYPDGSKGKLTLSEPESFSRVDVGAGLRFLLF